MVALPPTTSATRSAAVTARPGDVGRNRSPCRTSSSSRGSMRLAQPHLVEGIVRRHVGEHHCVAFAEAGHDLNGVHGAAAEFYLHALGFAAVGDHAEEADGALVLSERWPSDMQRVFNPFKLD